MLLSNSFSSSFLPAGIINILGILSIKSSNCGALLRIRSLWSQVIVVAGNPEISLPRRSVKGCHYMTF